MREVEVVLVLVHHGNFGGAFVDLTSVILLLGVGWLGRCCVCRAQVKKPKRQQVSQSVPQHCCALLTVDCVAWMSQYLPSQILQQLRVHICIYLSAFVFLNCTERLYCNVRHTPHLYNSN